MKVTNFRPRRVLTPEAREAIAGNFAVLLMRGESGNDAIEYVFAYLVQLGMVPDTDDARREAAGVVMELAAHLAELIQETSGLASPGGSPDASR